MPVPDTILVNVPRLTEQEPGFQHSVLLADHLDAIRVSAVTRSDGSEEPTAQLEEVSGRWMGAVAAMVADFAAIEDWTVDGTSVQLSAPRNLQGVGADQGEFALSVTAEAADPATPWSVQTVANLEPGRGLILSVLPYEPEDVADESPLRIVIAEHWKLELLPPIQGQARAVLYERNPTAPTEAEPSPPYWSPDATPLGDLPDPYYGTVMRWWIQPTDDDELLIRLLDNPAVGAVVRSGTRANYQPPAAAEGEEPPPPRRVVWPEGPLRFEGFTRGMLVAAYAIFPAAWSLQSQALSELGYTPTEPPEIEAESYLPATGYTATFTVTNEDGEDYVAESAVGDSFNWLVEVAGPADHSYGGRDYSFRAVVVDRLRVEWPLTLASDGLVAADVRDMEDVAVTSIAESRSLDDSAASLTVVIDGPRDTLAPYLVPNARWQWVIDGASPYVRFDGLRDGQPQLSQYVTADGRRWTRATVTLRNRWRQVDGAMYRGSVPLDGLTRSEAYQRLAEQVPLDEAEISVSEFLVNDAELPTTRPGLPAAWQPRIGSTIGQVIRELRETFGGEDRVWFRGEVFTFEPRELYLPQATFVRHPDDVDAPTQPPGLLIQGDWDGMFVESTSDEDFVNDLWVVGQDKDSPPERPVPLVAYNTDPSSWQNPLSPYYISHRRTVIVQKPELTTQEAVDTTCRNLWRVFHRFTYSAALAAPFGQNLYPGMAALVDPGTDPSATLALVEIVSMQTRLVAPGEEAIEKRYDTVYEVRLVTEEWVEEEA